MPTIQIPDKPEWPDSYIWAESSFMLFVHFMIQQAVCILEIRGEFFGNILWIFFK